MKTETVKVSPLLTSGVTGELQMVSRTAIAPSATNPRKAFNPETLEELAASIKAQGILQPILIRPVTGKKLKLSEFEIVAGERRWRAAGKAQLVEVPCIVREMTDAQVFDVQLIENLQRDDLSAIEEAEGYRQALDQKLHTIESLMEKLGKSRSHIFSRLRLVSLSKPVRDALLGGGIDVSIAGLIASVAGEASQAEVLKKVTKGQYGSGPMSFREAKRMIDEKYQVNLKAAPWKLEDANLVKAAGACNQCPKRAAMICTDLKCYEGKQAAVVQGLKAAAKVGGQKFLTYDEYCRTHHYI